MDRPNIAILGATGAVGRELLAVLGQRRFPYAQLRLLASPRSAGTTLRCAGRPLTVTAADDRAFDGMDLVFMCAGAERSRLWAPRAVEAGAIVIDNSSAFRMDPAVPLIVPEINADELEQPQPGAPRVDPQGNPCSVPRHHGLPSGTSRGTHDTSIGLAPGPVRSRIIANPNCSTIIMLMAVSPLRAVFGIERIAVATYQAASGAGAAAMAELRQQTRYVLEGFPPEPSAFPEPCAFNVFSHDSPVDPDTGLNVEERKLIEETRKIWRDPGVRISATCVRVPVMRAHTEAINVTLASPATQQHVRDVLEAAPGVRVVDERAAGDFPTPLKATGIDDALVGRIRPDPSQTSHGSQHVGFDLLVCADQLRKGAALNAVQIAERLVRK